MQGSSLLSFLPHLDPFIPFSTLSPRKTAQGTTEKRQVKPVKPNSLTCNNDFRRLYARGKSYVSPLLVTYIQKNRFGASRMGVTASKKTGKAVERNRSRRVIKEAFRSLYPELRTGYDFVFVARGRTGKAKTQDVLRVMRKHLQSAGLLS